MPNSDRKVAPALGTIGIKDFPPEGWARLVAALILTGVGLAPAIF